MIPAKEYYSDRERHLEEEEQPIRENKTSQWMKVFWIAVILFLFYLIFIRTGWLNRFFIDTQNRLQILYEKEPNTVYFILAIIVYFTIIFCLPSQMIVCILTAIIIKDAGFSFGLMLFASMLGSISIFFLTKITCSDLLYKSISTNEFFQVIMEENKSHPWMTAFFTRVIFISAGLKDYILSLISNPFSSYFVSALFLHSFYIGEAVLIAEEFSQIENYINDNKSWSQKSQMEKISMISMLVFIILTFAIITLVGLMVQKRLKERRGYQRDVELTNQFKFFQFLIKCLIL